MYSHKDGGPFPNCVIVCFGQSKSVDAVGCYQNFCELFCYILLLLRLGMDVRLFEIVITIVISQVIYALVIRFLAVLYPTRVVIPVARVWRFVVNRMFRQR